MLKSVKLVLYPTREQEGLFRRFSGTSRFVYNMCLAYMIQQYQDYGVTCKLSDLMSYIQGCKYSEEYAWLQEVPEAVQKQAMKDLLTAYKLFFKRGKGFPKFKQKSREILSFYQRTDKLHLDKKDLSKVKLTGVKEPVKFKCNSEIDLKSVMERPLNPRVKYDEKHWYLTFSYDLRSEHKKLTDEIIGVDLGIKNLAVVSSGVVYRNINKTRSVIQLEKRLKRLQRKVSKKYFLNKQGGKFVKTSNIIKLEQKIRLLHRRLSNIRDNYIHQITADLVKTKPNTIVIEDLNVSGMLKNRHLSKAVSQQCFYKFRQYLEYKCRFSGIKLILADRFYPSSKKCSCCGKVKKFLSLHERVYKCSNCGLVLDRDFNASLNLKNYALSL